MSRGVLSGSERLISDLVRPDSPGLSPLLVAPRCPDMRMPRETSDGRRPLAWDGAFR